MRKINLFIILIVLLAQGFTGTINSDQARFDIEKAPAPLFRDPVFDGAADPSVLWNHNTGEWWIFYTQRRASRIFDNVAYCYGTAIGIAVSSDYGKTWEYRGTAKFPVINPGNDTYWAPQVMYDAKNQTYHMFVTYINGIFNNWGGHREMHHYVSEDLWDWKPVSSIGTEGCIDAMVYPLQDGTWKMWYKNEKKGSFIFAAQSEDMVNWDHLEKVEIDNRRSEGPTVFEWQGKYWIVTDPTYSEITGLDIFSSEDAANWEFNTSILNNEGIRNDDNEQGRHPDVKVVGDRAFIFYFTHPGRIYKDGKEVRESNIVRSQRSSLQVAELEYQDGKIVCNRDKYLLPI
jgi:hypothetical protein